MHASIKRKIGDRVYWYEAYEAQDGTWRIQTVNFTEERGTWARPAIDYLTKEEATGAVAAGDPFRYLGGAGRRRSREDIRR